MRIVPSFLRWKPQTARGELPSERSPAELSLNEGIAGTHWVDERFY